jgi:hypothetical protein
MNPATLLVCNFCQAPWKAIPAHDARSGVIALRTGTARQSALRSSDNEKEKSDRGAHRPQRLTAAKYINPTAVFVKKTHERECFTLHQGRIHTRFSRKSYNCEQCR